MTTPVLDSLRKKKAQIEARIADITARETAKQRKLETRRLILVGRCCEGMAERDSEFAQQLKKHLEAFATRPADRLALGLDA